MRNSKNAHDRKQNLNLNFPKRGLYHVFSDYSEHAYDAPLYFVGRLFTRRNAYTRFVSIYMYMNKHS